MTTTLNKAAYSRYGKAPTVAIDVAALSDRARQRVVNIPLYYSTAAGSEHAAYFVINTTKKHALGPVGVPGILRAAYISSSAVPAGGTLDWQIVAYDASANAEILLTDTSTNPESITAREAQAQVLATTNVALAADDTLELHCIASNATVTQDAVGLVVTLVFENTETTPPTQTVD